MTQPLILVTGATRTIGSEVVKQLVGAHQKVRVLVRDPARVLKFGTGAEVVKGDLAKPEALTAAFAGVDKAFIRTKTSIFRFRKPGPLMQRRKRA